MRRMRLAVVLIGLLCLLSCAQELPDMPGNTQQTAEIEVLLTHGEEAITKSDSGVSVPEIGDLKVEIFKITESGDVRLYRDSYSETSGKKIPLNCADYRLLASHGDSLAVGFDRPYFSGISLFTLSPQESQIVETVVKVTNVRVSVKFGDNLVYDYPEFYAAVNSITKGGKKRSLKFYQDETRQGFVPLGELTLDLYANIDGEWKYYHSQPVQTKPGDDVVFTVDTKRLESSAEFAVTVQKPDMLPQTHVLSSAAYPVESPSFGGLSLEGEMVVTEGDTPVNDLKLDIVAEGNIKECLLRIDSDYLAAMGVPEVVDISDPQLAPSVRDALRAVGLRWFEGMRGRRFSYVDFSGVTGFLANTACDPDNMFTSSFSVSVVDERNNPGVTEHIGSMETGSMTFIQGIPAPEISVDGFGNNGINVMEVVAVADRPIKVEVQAKGRIEHCYLDISSPYMQADGIPGRVDLPHAGEDVREKLKSYGITWPEDMHMSVASEIDFSGLDDYMQKSRYDASKGEGFASFSVEVVNSSVMDESFRTSTAAVGSCRYLVPASPSSVDNYDRNDVWARRLHGYSTVLAEGNFEEWTLQYSTDRNQWTGINTVLDGQVLSCENLSGLTTTPTQGVEHYVRAIYHDNPSIVYELSSFITEPAAQVPDAGFENWTIADYTYYLDKVWGMGGTYTSRQWYLPWKYLKYWDVNSKKTMPANTTPREQPYKVFPTVSYSTDTPDGSGASAQMVGVYVCNMATSSSKGDGTLGDLGGLLGGVTKTFSSAAGEIFLGTADDAGNHKSEGTAFYSRPDKMKFFYKYAPKDSETFQVTVWLKDSHGRVIAQGGTTTGQASSAWTQMELALDYLIEDAKAEVIYISFRSSSCADADISFSLDMSLEMAGTSYRGHLGSVLKVDNIELIYE